MADLATQLLETHGGDLRQMPVDEFAKFVSGIKTNGQGVNRVDVARSNFRAPTFEERHQRIGPQGVPVPLDVTTGAPWQARLKLSFAPDDNARWEMLRNSFRGAEIEPVEGGQFIIRGVVDPETKVLTDMLVDEQGLTAKDLLDMASAAPEVVGAIAGMRAARPLTGGLKKSLTRIFAEAAAGSLGSQAVGGSMDAVVRLGIGQPVQPGEIAERRAFNFATETLLGAAGGKLVGTIGDASRAASASTTLESQLGVDAVERVAKETGIKIPLTIGERTGRPNVLKAEIISEKTPLGGRALRQTKEQAEEGMRELQRHLLGEGPLPPPSTVGSKAVETLRQYTRAAEDAFSMQRERLANQASADLATAIEQETGLARRVLKDEAGGAIRGGVISHHKAFRETAESLYEEVGSNPLIDTLPITKKLEAVKAEMVKGTRKIGEKEIITGFDEYGPITAATDVNGREVLREFVPEGLERFLSGVSKLDAETPLSELRALRSTLFNARKQSEILPGVSTRHLNAFAQSIDDAIESAASKLEDPGVVARLKAANKFYRDGMERFGKKGVLEILADPEQSRLGNFGLANQVMRDPDSYFRIKEVLTKPILDPSGLVASPAKTEQWNLAKKSILTEFEDRARLAGTGKLISGETFLAEINKLEPAVIDDLLGKNADRIIRGARTLSLLDKKKLDIDELYAALNSPKATVLEIDKLAQKQADLDRLYRNDVIGKFVKGEIGAEKINAGEFVERYIDIAKDKNELGRVMALLSDNPAVAEDVRRLTIQKIFQDAERNLTPADLARRQTGDRTVMVEPKRLFKSLDADADKLRTVLGDDSYRFLQDYLSIETARSAKDGAAAAVGGLVGGSLLNSILTFQLRTVPSQFKYFFISQVVTSSSLRAILKAGSKLDGATATRAIIASAPFVEAVHEDFGSDAARIVLEKFGVAASARSTPTEPAQSGTTNDLASELLQLFPE